MRKLLIVLLLLLPVQARASFVQAGRANMASATTTVCPLSSSVVVGHMEVIGVWTNSSPFVSTITSTRVTTWVSDGAANGFVSMWHGVVTSSGTDSITATLTSANLAGSVCGEYTTTTLNVTNKTGSGTVSVTTTQPITDLVVAAGGTTAIVVTGVGWTTRITATNSGTILLALADIGETSTGTYTSTMTGSNPGQVLDALFGVTGSPTQIGAFLAGP